MLSSNRTDRTAMSVLAGYLNMKTATLRLPELISVQVTGQHEQPDPMVSGPALAASGPAQWLLRPQGLHHNG